LAYANQHRPWELYRDLFYKLEQRCREAARPGHKFRFKNKLLSIDSSTIGLCVSMYDWAHFQRAKGAVKLHLVLDHDGYLPQFAVVTDGKKHDITVGRTLRFDRGTMVIFDKGVHQIQLVETIMRRRCLLCDAPVGQHRLYGRGRA